MDGVGEFSIVLDDEQGNGDQEDQSDKRQVAIANALRAVKSWTDEAGISYRDAGDIVGFSGGWVSERVSEWKRASTATS